MMIVCWSSKGGSGTSTVAASLALRWASGGSKVVLADMCGDLPGVLGSAVHHDKDTNEGVGMRAWLSADASVPADSALRLATPITDNLSLIVAGCASRRSASLGRHAKQRQSPNTAVQAQKLCEAFNDVVLVVDAGVLRPQHEDGADEVSDVINAATYSLLVLRPCYLALRAASKAAHKPDGIVLIEESGRVLNAHDVSDILEAPVVCRLGWDNAVVRAIDAGRLGSKLPRSLHLLDAVISKFAEPKDKRAKRFN